MSALLPDLDPDSDAARCRLFPVGSRCRRGVAGVRKVTGRQRQAREKEKGLDPMDKGGWVVVRRAVAARPADHVST